MLFRPPFFLPWLYSDLVWRMPGDQKTLYLTFDDGPVPGPTEFVLDMLNAADVKASFFVIGDNVSKYPAIFQRLVAAGHAIGNHTFHHLKGWGCTNDEYIHDIAMCKEEISKYDNSVWAEGSEKAHLFRPPYGRIRRSQIKELNNYKIIMWDVLTQDYSKHLSPEACLAGTIRATRPGSIIVFHDSVKAERNMTYALPRILDHFGGLGYNFKAI